jgi:Flp pilus assembly protein protease CpaA
VGLFLSAVFLAMLAVATVTDLRERRIPNRALAVTVSVALPFLVVADPGSLPGRLAAALLAGGAFLTLALLRPDGFGMGDVKLIGVMGLFLRLDVLVAVLIALVAASLVGLFFFVREGRAAAKATVPFAPFLALGGVAVLLAAPAFASAAMPDSGKFVGHEGVSFVVGRSQHGAPIVHEAVFRTTYSGNPRTISAFQQGYASDGSFETCGRYGHSQGVFWEYCIVAHFSSPEHASGVVHGHQGFRGVVGSKPFETHRWSAALQ